MKNNRLDRDPSKVYMDLEDEIKGAFTVVDGGPYSPSAYIQRMPRIIMTANNKLEKLGYKKDKSRSALGEYTLTPEQYVKATDIINSIVEAEVDDMQDKHRNTSNRKAKKHNTSGTVNDKFKQKK